jgi:hypothetical protein
VFIYDLLINSLRHRVESSDQRKECIIIVPIYRKGNKSDCCNYRGISLLLTSRTIVYNILLSKLSPDVDEIIEVYQCGFLHNRSTSDHIFSIN